MPLTAFEPAVLITERAQTHALDRTATGISLQIQYLFIFTDSEDIMQGYCDIWLLHETVTEYHEESNWD